MTSPPRPAAVLFDLDGTLADSKRDIAEALNAALVEQGRSRLDLETVATMIGDGAHALVLRGLSHGVPSPDDALLSKTLEAFHRAYTLHPCVHTSLMPGARAALDIPVKRGVVTNKPRAVTLLVLERLGVLDGLGSVYAGGDGPLKPSPVGIERTCAALGVSPADAWFVGDGPQDVVAGRTAGCFTIAVPGIADRDAVLTSQPDRVVSSLEQVAELARASLALRG